MIWRELCIGMPSKPAGNITPLVRQPRTSEGAGTALTGGLSSVASAAMAAHAGQRLRHMVQRVMPVSWEGFRPLTVA